MHQTETVFKHDPMSNTRLLVRQIGYSSLNIYLANTVGSSGIPIRGIYTQFDDLVISLKKSIDSFFF